MLASIANKMLRDRLDEQCAKLRSPVGIIILLIVLFLLIAGVAIYLYCRWKKKKEEEERAKFKVFAIPDGYAK